MGGAIGWGTIFSLTGFGPFVKTWPTVGTAGAFVEIHGTDLTGTTNVNFNGTESIFKVISSSAILAIVPAGTSTGKVHVVTPSGLRMSNVFFLMLP